MLTKKVVSRIANSCARRISNKQLLSYTLYTLETVAHINSAYDKDSLIESKNYANNYTDKYNVFVTKVNQQQQFVREGDRQANTTTSNLNKIHNQQCSRHRVLEKATSRTLYFKNVRETVCVGLYKDKTKQTTGSSNSVSLVCEENSRGLKISAIEI